MAILVNEEKKIFTLHTLNSTYQMMVDEYGFLLHLYYGRYCAGEMDYLLVKKDRAFAANPYEVGRDRTYSLDVLPREFPDRGSGDFRSPVMDIRHEDGSFGCDLRYDSYTVKEEKYSIPGLPAAYDDEGIGQTLEIYLKDEEAGIFVKLFYGVLPDCDVITRAVSVTNQGGQTIYLEKIQSACLDFVAGDFDLLTFNGRHAMERKMQRTSVNYTSQQIGSRRGTSSHQHNPMMILAAKEATEDHGSCYGMSFVYSGGFQGEAQKDQYNQTRIQLGLCEEQFSYPLEKGEEFFAPEVLLTYSGEGFAKLSHNLHRCIREHICRGAYRKKVKPVLLNSWEAVYFDFNADKIADLAKEAAKLGVELLVMDDGWFGKRDSDNSGLGDWMVNEKKLGCSLSDLINRVNAEGLKFGIWLEPEMVSEDSQLYRKHPDWVLCRPGHKPVRSRNQLVLDYSRKEVVDGIYHQLCDVLDQGNIEYVKWDMNRSICEVFTYGDKHQGKVMFDYMLGVYDLLERLLTRYPGLLIEGCSGGGGRFDVGMLYYTPQIWCSDNTDAIDRTIIQYGTSFGYPLSVTGSHVSAVPNHQTGRTTPLHTRGVVAMAGSLGYELDLGKLTAEEKEEIRQQIVEYKSLADLIHTGCYYRLSNPGEDKLAAWEIVSEDYVKVLFSAVLLETHGNRENLYVQLKGLKPGAKYLDQTTGQIYPADALMETGIPVFTYGGDYVMGAEYEAETRCLTLLSSC